MLRRLHALLLISLLGVATACSDEGKSDGAGGDLATGGTAPEGTGGSAAGGPAASTGGVGGVAALPPGMTVPWSDINSQPASWYGTQAAADVAANIIYYQNTDGGWPKNVDMTSRAAARASSTIDNGATTLQLAVLAKIYNALQNGAHLVAFDKGLDYLFTSQYENGGWPQVPGATDYKRHITFNDGAMTRVITLMDSIAKQVAPYAFVDDARVASAAVAEEKGIDCILKCQFVRNGTKTGWCAQHDELTLEPADARAYELASLSGQEGAGVLTFLMSIDDPSPEVVEAVQAAVRWFVSVQITGISVQKVTTPEEDVIVVDDPTAAPTWARFYQLEDDVPFFCGRDGVRKYSLAEIELERRTGYSWYGTAPAKALALYPAWQKTHSPDDDALAP